MRKPDDVQARAEAYLAKWQPRLGLGGWRIALRFGETDSGTSANSEASWTWEDAIITIAPDFEKQRDVSIDAGLSADRVLEELVIHELLHFVDQPMAMQVEQIIDRFIGKDSPASTMARDVFSDYQELWINRVIRALLRTGDAVPAE